MREHFKGTKAMTRGGGGNRLNEVSDSLVFWAQSFSSNKIAFFLANVFIPKIKRLMLAITFLAQIWITLVLSY